MGWIKKYWYIILALALVLGFAFVPFVQTVLFYSLLILMLFFGKYPLMFFITIAFVIVSFFMLARKRDMAQNQLKKKTWIMRHIRQLVVVTIVILGLAFWGFKAMEKSESELFIQLYEIMENNIPNSSTSYTRELTNEVCPIVTPEKLAEMMQDDYARKRIRFFNRPSKTMGKDGDNSWWVKKGSSELVITINLISNECKAYLYRDAGL